MKTYLLIVAVITMLQFSAVFTEISAPEEILNEEIVSPSDSKNDTTHVEDDVLEVVLGTGDPPKDAIVSFSDSKNDTTHVEDDEGEAVHRDGDLPRDTIMRSSASKNVTIRVEDDVSEVVHEDGDPPKDVNMSSSTSKNDTAHVEDDVGEVVHVEGDPPKDVTVQESEDPPVPSETSQERLDAIDDESILNILDIQQEVVEDVVQSEQDEGESTKKDLSSYGIPPLYDPDNLHAQGWFQHRMYRKDNHITPIIMKEPTFNSLITIPLWTKLRRSFARKLVSKRY